MSIARHCCFLCLLMFSGSASAAETVTVRPRDTGEALINPKMGWTMHFYSNVARNYGSKLEPSDTLDDFPGVSTVYLRLQAIWKLGSGPDTRVGGAVSCQFHVDPRSAEKKQKDGPVCLR